MASPFSTVSSLDWMLHGTMFGHPWCLLTMVFPTSPPHRGAYVTEGHCLVFVLYFHGASYSQVGPLVLLQLPITIAFYDLHKCRESILIYPIPQENPAVICKLRCFFCSR